MAKKLRIEYQVEPDAGSAGSARGASSSRKRQRKPRPSAGRARIAISGGSTPKATFALLADADEPWRSRMPWDKLDLFWVDERCVPPDHADSNYRMTREALLDHVPLKPEQIHRMEGELEPQKAAARYESQLRNSFRLEGAESPRFDLVEPRHGSRRPHRFALPAHRRAPRDEPPGHRQPRRRTERLLGASPSPGP